MHIDSVLHVWRTEDVSPLMYFSAVFGLILPLSGTEGDGTLITDAIQIINKLKQSNDDYKSLSKDNQATLITLLQEDHDRRDMGVIGKTYLKAHDIRVTMEWVSDKVSHPSALSHWLSQSQSAQLENLNARSSFEYILLSSCNQVDHSSSPTVLLSEAGCEFISQYLRFEPTQLAKHLNTFVTNCAGMNSMSTINQIFLPLSDSDNRCHMVHCFR
jgi:hypothetical protein